MDGDGDDIEAGDHFPGQREDSRIYKLGSYFFHRDKIRPSSGTIYYRCIEHITSKCKVRAKSGLDGVDLVVTDSTRHHTHSVNPHYETYISMRRELVQLCMQQKRISMDKIYCNFLNSVKNKELREMFDIDSIRDAVKYRRSLNAPKDPATFNEAVSILEDPKYAYLGRTADDEGNLFQGKVGEPGHESILFTSERFIPFISKAEVIVSDATFLMCPLMVGAMQVFIVAFFAFGKVFPFAFSIMSSKTTDAYAAITSNFKERGLCAGKVITDWELAERQGWKRNFKKLLIWGCLWHFQRALFRKAKKLGLGKFLKPGSKQTEIHLIIKLASAVPRLPANRILRAYKLLLRRARRSFPTSARRKLLKLFNYFLRQWIKRTNTEELSVFMKTVKASSGMESVNRRINSLLPKAHPSFLQAVDLIRDLEQEYYTEFQRIRFDGRGKRKLFSSMYKKKSILELDNDKEIWAACKKDPIHFLSLVQPSMRKSLATLCDFEDDPFEPVVLGADNHRGDVSHVRRLV